MNSPRRPEVLRWLARLRWEAVAGQLAAVVFAGAMLRLELPWWPLLGGILFAALSNHWLADLSDVRGEKPQRRIATAIAGDVLLLTWMLHWTGGGTNPFVVFYLLHLVLAAMLLERRGRWIVAGLCAACFALTSYVHEPFRGPQRWVQDGLLSYPLHRIGGAVALVLAGTVLSLLVHRMRRAQAAADAELAVAARRADEGERFKALATLSAGVAHELGTPLGTIAVASKELERSLLSEKRELLDDARLIREEVERCRGILRRLDAKSTGGAGSPPEAISTAEIGGRVAARLTESLRVRLDPRDFAEGTTVRVVLEPLLQGLVVLVENACEADASGQPVQLETRIEGGRHLALRVLDRGKGLTESARRRAGEPYFTTKPKDGTGLGLYLVKTLLTELGGDVSLHPRADGGTCAILRVPLL